MYTMLEHPEIAHIERTGYPSWIKDLDVDEEEEYYEEDETTNNAHIDDCSSEYQWEDDNIS